MIEKVISDIDLGQICDSGQCFRMSKIDKDQKPVTGLEEEYEIIAGDRYLRVAQAGEINFDDEKQFSFSRKIVFDCSEDEFNSFWSHYFDLGLDYGYIKSLADDSDAYMQVSIRNGMGIRILNQDLWEMIVTFLISQQNNIPRIKKCINNICQKYGEKLTNSIGDEYYAFPTAERIAVLEEDALMECNLGYRSKYVVRTAREIVEKKYDLQEVQRMEYSEARTTILKMYGVGNKVADCICLFALHHINAFPIDTHIRQVIDREYKGEFPFAKYEGYLGIMQQYIFFNDLKK